MMEKILIIDDEPDICLLLERFFKKKGYTVDTFTNGKEAVTWLQKNKVALVICDFKLPDYTGIEILQKIKIIDPAIKVIIITGYSDVRIAVEALKKGAFDYVTKPLYPDEILLTVQNALKQKEQSEETEKGTSKKTSKSSGLSRKHFVKGNSPQALLV